MSTTPDSVVPTSEYDIFISYAHQGDHSSREAVTTLVRQLHKELEADFSARFGRDLEIFFDKEDLRDFDHWQVRCYRALRSSRFFIVFLSRSYLRSAACRWEWEEWCKLELKRGMTNQSAASLWFVKLEDLDAPEDAELLRQWKGNLRQRFHVLCHEWSHDDPAAFLDASARSELQVLTEHVAQRLRLLALDRASRGNLPWPNTNFVGREPELARLRTALLDAPEPTPVGLHGVGGMGKTALAHAFAYHEADAFPGGCWLLRCEGQERLLTVFRSLVTDLDIKLTDDEKLDDALAVRRVFEVLRPRGAALFLLDNVDRPVLLAPEQMEMLAAATWARVLYTTRLSADDFTRAGAAIRPLDLDRLPEDQAVDLIRLYQPEHAFISPAHATAAREIVRELSGLTIAVETAAVYLGQCDPRVIPPEQKQHAADIEDYLLQLRTDLHSGGSEGVMSQLREVTATLRPTLNRLDAPARTVLQIASLLAPDGVALPWVRTIASQSHPELAEEAATGESDPWTQLIRSLIGMRLFQPTPEPRVVAVHRILQRVLKTEIPEGREMQENRLEVLIRARDALLEDITVWKDARWELNPMEALAWLWAEPSVAPPNSPDTPLPPIHPSAVWLLNRTGLRRQHLAEWSLAEPLMRRALSIDEVSLGSDHPNVAGELNNIAMLLQATNRLTESELLMRRALTIDEASFGEDHFKVARDLHNLAGLFHVTNRLSEADPLYRRALAIDEICFGPDHPEVATDLNSIAQLLQATNRFGEAEPLMRRALAIDEASSGLDHPNVARDLNNLALLFYATNRLDEAEPLIRRALAIDEASFGKEHPNVATRLNNLAVLLQATNQLAEAEPLMRRALAINEVSFGRNHPEVATALNNLAFLLKSIDRRAEAEPLYRRALAIDEASFGPDHPNVARDLNNLALFLYATKRLVECEPLFRRRVAMSLKFTRTTSHADPHLGAAIRNYAGLQREMGRSEDEIEEMLSDLGRRYGMVLAGAGGR